MEEKKPRKLNNRDSAEKTNLIHMKWCLNWLFNSLKIMEDIRQEREDSRLIVPAFRFSLIEYSKAFTNTVVLRNDTGRKLKNKHVPQKFREIHKEIIKERHTVHAHSDISLLEPQIQFLERKGEGTLVFISSRADDSRMLIKLNELMMLVEGVLESVRQDYDDLVGRVFCKKES